MSANRLFRLAGWSAYFHAVANVIGFLTLILFFVVGGVFGPINDASAALFALALILPALALHRMHRLVLPPLSLVVTAVGLAAMLTTAVLQSLLVFGLVEYEQTLAAVLTSNGVIGAWAALNGVLAILGSTLPRKWAWLSIVAGAGLVLIITGFWLGGQEHPLTYIGGIVALVGLLIWAIWLGRLFLAASEKEAG